jgi:cell division transport system ATP-binding protein
VELLQGICREGAAVVMTTHNLQLLEQFPGTIYRFHDHQMTLEDDPAEDNC